MTGKVLLTNPVLLSFVISFSRFSFIAATLTAVVHSHQQVSIKARKERKKNNNNNSKTLYS